MSKVIQDSTRNRVRNLMANFPELRDSDKLLWLRISREHGLILTKKQKAIFMKVPGEAIVSRRRREFNAIYPASPRITEERYKAFKKILSEYSSQFGLRKLFRKKGIIEPPKRISER